MPKKALPDFEDMFAVAERIRELMLAKSSLDIRVKQAEAKIVEIVTTNPKYFKEKKAPAMNYVTATYLATGIEEVEDVNALRLAHAVACSELEEQKIIMDIFKMQLEIYRTESANERYSSMS